MRWTMPLALDFTSTLERGWIFPVATTERAMSPRVTSANLEGSILLLGFRAARTAKKAPESSAAMIANQIQRRLCFEFLPFAAIGWDPPQE
jgi:hypothetical protein